MNELSLVINQNPGSIELNFDALEEQLDKKLSEYKGAVFTEDTKTIAKAEVANLRKLKKDIEDSRKKKKLFRISVTMISHLNSQLQSLHITRLLLHQRNWNL